jgi:hypothetical protein
MRELEPMMASILVLGLWLLVLVAAAAKLARSAV